MNDTKNRPSPRTEIISFRPRSEADMLRELVERQPVRRGDVVQLKANCGLIAHSIHVVTGVLEDGKPELNYGGGWRLDQMVRIGRAKFYPDGTPVED